jgi:HD-like signal output (HDOD) protein
MAAEPPRINLDSDDLKTEVKGYVLAVKDLPTLPQVLDEVTKLVQDPESSTEQIAKAISTDQVLSAKVLKMVNSPVYGFPGRISSIQHALVLLGFNVIRGIIISTSVFDMMAQTMKGLWEHSLGACTASGIIAAKAGFEDPEEFTVAGLLHDLGKVVAAVQLPELQERVLDVVARDDLSYYAAERKVLGFGHDRINAWIATHWHLPGNIREAMSHHHKPSRAQHYRETASVVHVADFLVRAFEFGWGGDDHISFLDPQAVAFLKLRMADLESIMDELSEKFVDISDLTF